MFIYLNIYRKFFFAFHTGKNYSSSGNIQNIFKKIKFVRVNQEALLMKIGVPIDKTNQNRRKIHVKELIFSKLQIKW